MSGCVGYQAVTCTPDVGLQRVRILRRVGARKLLKAGKGQKKGGGRLAEEFESFRVRMSVCVCV